MTTTTARVAATLLLASAGALAAPGAHADAYEMDTAHTFIQFSASHLGYGWVVGRFNSFTGQFTFDPGREAGYQSATAVIDMTSVDSNHAERDRHLGSDDFLDIGSFKQARFVSTGYAGDASGGTLSGELTFLGVTAPIQIEVEFGGAGDDPWGGYRAGFMGRTTLNLPDFGLESRLVSQVDIDIYVEGVRK